MTKVYDAENLSVFLNGAQVMGEARKRYDKTVTIHVTPNVWELPIREHGESEAEFIERARRMPR